MQAISMIFCRIVFGVFIISYSGAALAIPLKSATVTAVENDVKISRNSSSARLAISGEKFDSSSTLLTGRKSRAELTFPDKTITRIGANSVFRFSAGSREMEIERGSFLLNVPKSAGGATIRTATVTAAITGTTTMMEYSPDKWVKFIVIEGTAHLINKAGDKMQVAPGQMVVMHPNAARFPRPVILNMQKLVKTSGLMEKKVFGEMRKPAVLNVDRSVKAQLSQRRRGHLLPARTAVRGLGIRGDTGNETKHHHSDTRKKLPPPGGLPSGGGSPPSGPPGGGMPPRP